MRMAVIVAIALLLTGCSGYRYSIIEEHSTYLLKGEFYNNNPFIKIKARIPNSYLIRKHPDNIASKEDIRSTKFRNLKVTDGFIVDRDSEVEIRLLVFDPGMNSRRLAYENGLYKLKRRLQVDSLKAYMENEENDILGNLNP